MEKILRLKSDMTDMSIMDKTFLQIRQNLGLTNFNFRSNKRTCQLMHAKKYHGSYTNNVCYNNSNYFYLRIVLKVV